MGEARRRRQLGAATIIEKDTRRESVRQTELTVLVPTERLTRLHAEFQKLNPEASPSQRDFVTGLLELAMREFEAVLERQKAEESPIVIADRVPEWLADASARLQALKKGQGVFQ